MSLKTAEGMPLALTPVGRSDLARGWLVAAGTPCMPPPPFWHHMRTRDAAGSSALRGATDETAGALLSAAEADLRAGRNELPSVAGVLAGRLPNITHPGLRAGVIAAVRHAAVLRIRLDDVITRVRGTGATQDTVQDATRDSEQNREGGGRAGRPGPADQASATVDEVAALEALWGCGLGADDLATPRQNSDGPRWWLAPHATSGQLTSHLSTAEAFFAGRIDQVNEALLPRVALPWPRLIGCAGAVARRAVSPLVSDQQRAVLLDLLDWWAATVFAADPSGFRVGMLNKSRNGAAVTADGRYLSLTPSFRSDANALWVATGEAAPLSVGAASPDGGDVTRVYTWPRPWGTRERIHRFTALARQRGPVPWQPTIADQLAAGTGLDRGAAAALWATFPYTYLGATKTKSRVHPHELATTLGVTQADLKAGAEVFADADVDTDERLAVLDESMPDDPALLWDEPDAMLDRLADAWCTRVGHQVPLSATLMQSAPQVHSVTAAQPLRAIAQPDRSALLTRAAATEVTLVTAHTSMLYMLRSDRRPYLHDNLVAALDQCLEWAYGELPAGDPVRAGAPRALELLRERLTDDSLLLDAGLVDDDGAAQLPRFDGLVDVDTWPPSTPLEDASVIVCHKPPTEGFSYNNVYIRPARLTKAQLDSLVPTLSTLSMVRHVARLLGTGHTNIADRIAAADLPAGGYEKNPTLTVPDLVAEVAARHTLAPDPAALYLQLLALPDPTNQNIQRWNGWKATRFKQAAAALRDAGLVVEEKRPRARRTMFVPGEWQESIILNHRKALPMEQYKLAIYPDLHDPWTVPELFGEAWRVRGGA